MVEEKIIEYGGTVFDDCVNAYGPCPHCGKDMVIYDVAYGSHGQCGKCKKWTEYIRSEKEKGFIPVSDPPWREGKKAQEPEVNNDEESIH
jgi:ssDNA-binding Zn-finger/Zn-ribbon topoisomerase 1